MTSGVVYFIKTVKKTQLKAMPSDVINAFGKYLSIAVILGLIVLAFGIYRGKKKCYSDKYGYSSQCSRDEWCSTPAGALEGICKKRVGCLYNPTLDKKELGPDKACQRALTSEECKKRGCTFKPVSPENDSRCVNTCWVDDGKNNDTKHIPCVDDKNKKPPCLKCGLYTPDCSVCAPLSKAEAGVLNYDTGQQPTDAGPGRTAMETIVAYTGGSDGGHTMKISDVKDESPKSLALTSCAPGYGSWEVLAQEYTKKPTTEIVYYDNSKGKNVWDGGIGSSFPEGSDSRCLNSLNPTDWVGRSRGVCDAESENCLPCIYGVDPNAQYDSCLGWKQTKNCSPLGNPEPGSNKGCDELIKTVVTRRDGNPNGRISGYCLCGDPNDPTKQFKANMVGCEDKKEFTCRDACQISWKQRAQLIPTKAQGACLKKDFLSFPSMKTPQCQPLNINPPNADAAGTTCKDGFVNCSPSLNVLEARKMNGSQQTGICVGVGDIEAPHGGVSKIGSIYQPRFANATNTKCKTQQTQEDCNGQTQCVWYESVRCGCKTPTTACPSGQSIGKRATAAEDATCVPDAEQQGCSEDNKCPSTEFCKISSGAKSGICLPKKGCFGIVTPEDAATYDEGSWNKDKTCIVDVYDLVYGDCTPSMPWLNDCPSGWTNSLTTPIPRAAGKGLCVPSAGNKCPAETIGGNVKYCDPGSQGHKGACHDGDCVFGSKAALCYKKK
jgi:hypothetical protein